MIGEGKWSVVSGQWSVVSCGKPGYSLLAMVHYRGFFWAGIDRSERLSVKRLKFVFPGPQLTTDHRPLTTSHLIPGTFGRRRLHRGQVDPCPVGLPDQVSLRLHPSAGVLGRFEVLQEVHVL